jgi:hypothetical protein
LLGQQFVPLGDPMPERLAVPDRVRLEQLPRRD